MSAAATPASDLARSLTDFANAFANKGHAALAGAIREPFALVAGMVVLLFAVALLLRRVREPASELALRLIGLGVVATLALDSNVFYATIMNLLGAGAEQFLRVLWAGAGTPGDMWAMLDEVARKVAEVSDKYQDLSSGLNPADALGDRINSWIVLGFGMVVVTMGLVYMLIAVMGSRILAALAPLFFLFWLLPATRSVTRAWIGQLAGYFLAIVLTGLTVMLTVRLFAQGLEVANPEDGLAAFTHAFASGLLALGMMKHVFQKAAHLGGGIVASTFGVFGASAARLSSTARTSMRAVRPRNVRAAIGRMRQDREAIAAAWSMVRGRRP